MKHNLRTWFASLNDVQIFGINLCFCNTGTWETFYFFYHKEHFFNQDTKKWVPGTSICFFGIVIELSKVKDWAKPVTLDSSQTL